MQEQDKKNVSYKNLSYKTDSNRL